MKTILYITIILIGLIQNHFMNGLDYPNFKISRKYYKIPVVATAADIKMVNDRFEKFGKLINDGKNLSDIFLTIGLSFTGIDYKINPIESGYDEFLVGCLTGMDCVTFVENSLAISLCINEKKLDFNDFLSKLRLIRYRKGILEDYTSRLHYFTDWIYDAVDKKICRDVTEIAGREYSKIYIRNVFLMSEKYNKSKNLSRLDRFIFDKLRSAEFSLNSRFFGNVYHYIPKEFIGYIENNINSGDIIAITTNVPGLDIKHVGIAVRNDDGHIHLLHAQNIKSKIKVSEQPLVRILAMDKIGTGIMILRM